jgi:hypothetical protein
VFVVVAVAALAASSASQVSKSNPRLVVFLEPLGSQFVPLQDGRGSPADAPPEQPTHNFLVMAVDKDHPPEKPYAFATGLARLGETRKVAGARLGVQVLGSVTVSAPGVAKYEAELLIGGEQSSASAAFVNFSSLK